MSTSKFLLGVFGGLTLAAAAAAQQAIAVSAQPFPGTTVLPIAPPALEMRKGKPVSEQLRAHGQRAEWDVVWEAPDYMLDRDMTIPGDFESAITHLLKGANEAGASVRAVFYRGNKVVRISEF